MLRLHASQLHSLLQSHRQYLNKVTECCKTNRLKVIVLRDSPGSRSAGSKDSLDCPSLSVTHLVFKNRASKLSDAACQMWRPPFLA
jgi:hypothetical protein